MTEKKRLANWGFAEVSLFIELCEEHKIMEKSDGKKFRVLELMKNISEEMAKSGFIREASSLVTKWKQLKQSYRAAIAHNGKSGNDPSKFVYVEKMSRLMRARPRTTFPELNGVERTSNVLNNASEENSTIPEASTSKEVEDHGLAEASTSREIEDADLADFSANNQDGRSERKRQRRNRSFGAALADFSEDFGNRMRSINKEFLQAQKQLQEETNNFLKEEMEKDRQLLRELFQ